MTRIALIIIMTITLGGAAYLASRPDTRAPVRASMRVTEALGGDTQGYAKAIDPRKFSFPADHGPHPAYRTEWWYYTGNLETREGRHFGYQLTFFRTALSPQQERRTSDWATNQMFMAHFALTDVAGEQFYAFDRFSRAALGLAGAQAKPFRVWLEDWSASGDGARALPMHLVAGADHVAIDLSLESAKPVVPQGDNGLSQKGAEPGNASYYYSLTRMPTSGTIRIGDERFLVDGLSWMDREWSTSSLEQNQVGWDWFALQLSNDSELMYYQLRTRQGPDDRFSSGVLIRPNGSIKRLNADDIRIEVLDHWESPHSGARYPAGWHARVPSEALELEITPYLADQELDVSVRYWEGAVQVRGTHTGRLLSGSGYVELTGYADEDGTQ